MARKDLQSILQALKQLNVIWEKLPAAFYVVDEQYTLQWLSQNARQWFPQFQEGAAKCYQALWQREAPCPQCPLPLPADSEPQRSLRTIERNGNVERVYESFTVPLPLNSAPIYFRMILDVTQNWQIQQQRAEHHHLIEAIFNSSSDAIIFLDNNDRIVKWNRGAEKLFGFTADEMIGQSILKIIPQELMEVGELFFIKHELEKEGTLSHYETQRLTRSGQMIYVDLTSTLIQDTHGNVIGRSEIIKDITQRKELELELRRSVLELSKLNELNEILHTAHEIDEILWGILVAITSGEGLRFNRAIALLKDKDNKVLRGHLGVGPSTSAEANIIWGKLQDHYRSLKDIVEIYRTELSQQQFTVNELVKQLRIPLSAVDHLLVHTLNARQVYRVENGRVISSLKLSTAVGDTTLQQLLNTDDFVIVPLVSKNETIGLIIADNCVTRREIAEEDVEGLRVFAHQASVAIENAMLYQSLEDRIQELQQAYRQLEENQKKLIRAERLAALGEMAAKVAHEIRNPLVSIGGFANLIDRRIGDNPEIKKYASIIREQVLNLENILNNILNVSRPQAPAAKKTFDVHQMIHKVATILSTALQERNIRLVLQLDCSVPQIYGDEKMLYHALLNLFKNAMEAFPEGQQQRTIRLQTRCKNQHIDIAVVDNGMGIPPELHEKIFQPFFTTKSGGTGLGLSIVKQIVQSHGGQIFLKSKPEKGTTVTIRLKRQQTTQTQNSSAT